MGLHRYGGGDRIRSISARFRWRWLTPCIHLAPLSKAVGTARAAGHSEVLYGMVTFSAMLSSTVGYIGPCWDMLGHRRSWERIALA
jgi:hypothetical protein